MIFLSFQSIHVYKWRNVEVHKPSRNLDKEVLPRENVLDRVPHATNCATYFMRDTAERDSGDTDEKRGEGKEIVMSISIQTLFNTHLHKPQLPMFPFNLAKTYLPVFFVSV